MEFGLSFNGLETQKTACIIVPVFEEGKLDHRGKSLDKACDNTLTKIIKSGDITGKQGQSLLIHNPANIEAERILLVGCGKEKELNEGQYEKILAKISSDLKNLNSKDAVCYLHELKIKGRNLSWKIQRGTQAIVESEYSSDHLKSKKSDDKPNALHKFIWSLDDKQDKADAEKGIATGQALGLGINLAKELGDLPGNICTPSYLANQANSMDSQYNKIKTKILEENEMEKLGMGALLSVSRGSRQPAKFIIMDYKGGPAKQAPIVLIGKGLTFDSGGVSIKPSQAMDEMKYDMCGGASVFGAMKTIAELGLAINVIGVVPSSENMPDGDANKPGDIVTSLSGQTIEILNTDAEGRLILCDAITYVERFKPAVVIDVATLTGACVIALGKHASGMYSNDDKLAKDLQQASDDSYDRIWQLPLWDDYQDQIKSNFADMANVGGRDAGSITAACFLSRYATQYKWAHLDIAGTAWLSGGEKGSTGRPVGLLCQYVMNQTNA